VIQPHRYTRLGQLFDEFVASVRMADAVLVMEVYPAGEKPIRGVTGERLCEKIRTQYPKKFVAYTPMAGRVVSTLSPWCGKDDLILFLGAGDITKIAHQFAKELS